MAIEDLLAVVVPPAVPSRAGPRDRRVLVEQALGLALPRDVYDVASRYGTGRFGGGIAVFNPFEDDYVARVRDICDCYRDLRHDEGFEEVPCNIYPESQGLFPWGESWHGYIMWWLTRGEPSSWPTVWTVGREPWNPTIFECSMTTLLAKIFSEPVACTAWDPEWQSQNLIGKPFRQHLTES